jgi:hypothetical protein
MILDTVVSTFIMSEDRFFLWLMIRILQEDILDKAPRSKKAPPDTQPACHAVGNIRLSLTQELIIRN